MPNNDFGSAIADFVTKCRKNGEQVMRKVALDVFRGVVQRTPVDTGRARGSWNVDINRVNKTVDTDPAERRDPPALGAPPGPANLSQAAGKVFEAKWGDEIYISNNVPYIRYLEDGSSQQAPEPGAMVGSTVQEARDALNKAVQELD